MGAFLGNDNYWGPVDDMHYYLEVHNSFGGGHIDQGWRPNCLVCFVGASAAWEGYCVVMAGLDNMVKDKEVLTWGWIGICVMLVFLPSWDVVIHHGELRDHILGYVAQGECGEGGNVVGWSYVHMFGLLVEGL
jgi:hypothetical protein